LLQPFRPTGRSTTGLVSGCRTRTRTDRWPAGTRSLSTRLGTRLEHPVPLLQGACLRRRHPRAVPTELACPITAPSQRQRGTQSVRLRYRPGADASGARRNTTGDPPCRSARHGTRRCVLRTSTVRAVRTHRTPFTVRGVRRTTRVLRGRLQDRRTAPAGLPVHRGWLGALPYRLGPGRNREPGT